MNYKQVMEEEVLKKEERIWEIDFLRSLAVVGMIIFHVYYMLNEQNLVSLNLFSGGWEIFGNMIRSLFFMLIGTSLVLSWQRQNIKKKPLKNYYRRHIKRAGILLLLGLVFTLISTQIDPDQVIRFGVLSFIGTGI